MIQLKIGDRIAYSVQFLKSIFESQGEMALARGKIVELQKIGESIVLATIEWDEECKDMPKRVNVKNLAHVGPNSGFCSC